MSGINSFFINSDRLFIAIGISFHSIVTLFFFSFRKRKRLTAESSIPIIPIAILTALKTTFIFSLPIILCEYTIIAKKVFTNVLLQIITNLFIIFNVLSRSSLHANVFHILFFSAVIYFKMGGSLSPTIMTGATYHQKGIVRPLMVSGIFLCQFRLILKRRLLLPPFERYLCSVSSSFALRRSCKALRTVDCESFNSFAIVGIAGQHSPSLFALSAR